MANWQYVYIYENNEISGPFEEANYPCDGFTCTTLQGKHYTCMQDLDEVPEKDLMKFHIGDKVQARDLDGTIHYGVVDSRYIGIRDRARGSFKTFPEEAVSHNKPCPSTTNYRGNVYFCDELEGHPYGHHHYMKYLGGILTFTWSENVSA